MQRRFLVRRNLTLDRACDSVDIRLGDGEVRDSVSLGEHDDADRIPTLDALVLHFDFYGRLTAIEVTGSATSVLPPGLIDN